MNQIIKVNIWFCLSFLLLFTACVKKPNSASKYHLMVVAGRGQLFFGHRVVYAVNESGVLLNLNLPKQEDVGSDPAWSPDGRWIAHSHANPNPISASDYDIYIMDTTDYSNNVRVTHSIFPQSSAWSPDSTQIAFQAYDAVSHHNAIYLLNVECVVKGESCTLEPTFLVSGMYPDWSPDGKKIVYLDVSNDQIRIVDIQSPNDVAPISHGLKDCGFPQWSPDGKMIAFICNKTIYSVDIDGGIPVSLVTGVGSYLKWTPDGNKIAFIGTEALDPNLGQILDMEGTVASVAVFIMDTNGANVTRITKNNKESISWFTWIPMNKAKTSP